jgi:putative transposase
MTNRIAERSEISKYKSLPPISSEISKYQNIKACPQFPALHPADYPWSSYRRNAQGKGDGLLSPHACYQALGRDKAERQVNDRELFRDHLEGGVLAAIRQATHGGYCLGSDRFKQEVAAMLKRRVAGGQAGRPKKQEAHDTPQGTLF